MHAITESVIETVQLLLEYDDIDINAKCIWMHKTFNNIQNLSFWIQFKHPIFYGILVDDLNWTALMIAATDGNTKLIQLLLSHNNIDVNIRDIWM